MSGLGTESVRHGQSLRHENGDSEQNKNLITAAVGPLSESLAVHLIFFELPPPPGRRRPAAQ